MLVVLAVWIVPGAAQVPTYFTSYSQPPIPDPCANSPTNFYAFGPAVGDITTPAGDDVNFGIGNALNQLSPAPAVLGQTYGQAFLSDNGYIAFGTGPATTNEMRPFPLQGTAPGGGTGIALVAPFWADADFTNQTGTAPPPPGYFPYNQLYYRWGYPSDSDAGRMAADVAARFPSEPPFTPYFAIVAT